MNRLVVTIVVLACLATASRGAAAPPRAPRTPTAAVPRAGTDSTAGPPQRAAARRLDEVRIEGEIPVPQVLFITAREAHRFTDHRHRRYLRTSLQLGQDTAFPARVVPARAIEPHERSHADE
jgi:hypothetical protein